MLVPFIDQSEILCGLLDDPRIEGLVASLCGREFCYTAGDGNWYSGDTGCALLTPQMSPRLPLTVMKYYSILLTFAAGRLAG